MLGSLAGADVTSVAAHNPGENGLPTGWPHTGVLMGGGAGKGDEGGLLGWTGELSLSPASTQPRLAPFENVMGEQWAQALEGSLGEVVTGVTREGAGM